MKPDVKTMLLFVTVLLLAIVTISNWRYGEWKTPSLEIDIRFKVSIDGDADLRKKS